MILPHELFSVIYTYYKDFFFKYVAPGPEIINKFWELTPLLARDTKKRELLDPATSITHSIDTWRYACNYTQKPYSVGTKRGAHPLMWR